MVNAVEEFITSLADNIGQVFSYQFGQTFIRSLNSKGLIYQKYSVFNSIKCRLPFLLCFLDTSHQGLCFLLSRLSFGYVPDAPFITKHVPVFVFYCSGCDQDRDPGSVFLFELNRVILDKAVLFDAFLKSFPVTRIMIQEFSRLHV